MQGWLRAGLIGVLILVVLDLLGLIPFAVCFTWPLGLLTYVLVGVLAASYMPPVRDAGAAAGQGALAALVASLGGGLVWIVINVIQASAGGMARAFNQIPPQLQQQLYDSGISPNFALGVGGVSIFSSICCSIGVLVAVALGALGGAIYAASKPR